jgi:hypothetical protein
MDFGNIAAASVPRLCTASNNTDKSAFHGLLALAGGLLALAVVSAAAMAWSWFWGYKHYTYDDHKTIVCWWRTRKPAANDPVFGREDAA